MHHKIQFVNASFAYNENSIFEGLTISFATDKISFLTGTSGIGKTTLLKIISGKLKLKSGELINPIKRFSYAYQDIRLVPYLSARENMLYIMPKEKSKAEKLETVDALLERVGLAKYGNFFPRELSGGMQRRLQFARCLAHPAEFFLLDEIFESLDAETANLIMRILLDEAQQKKHGAICVTHKIPFESELTETVNIQDVAYCAMR